MAQVCDGRWIASRSLQQGFAGSSTVKPHSLLLPACRVSGAPAASYDCLALESVIAQVCIVRIPRHVGVKRAKEPAEDDPVSQFVLNDLVGPPPVDLLPVVREELWERMQEHRLAGIKPTAAREELGKMVETESEGDWLRGWKASG